MLGTTGGCGAQWLRDRVKVRVRGVRVGGQGVRGTLILRLKASRWLDPALGDQETEVSSLTGVTERRLRRGIPEEGAGHLTRGYQLISY